VYIYCSKDAAAAAGGGMLMVIRVAGHHCYASIHGHTHMILHWKKCNMPASFYL